MQSKATSPKQYLDGLPEERKALMSKLRKQILDNLPKGIEETMSYGMLGYVIPHSVYPDGYHCNTKLPLPFMNLASQKNFVAVYSMVLYSKKELMDWFILEYKKRCKYKLDMGKSCIRFKRMDDIPFDLIGELTAKVSTEEWIDIYQSTIKKK
ncbi:DUF1801 domain-containing protein [uncultured Algibacter sp.]|uniref:DUF1801 domain-containing protein n=1 Tax=uncultured Algibacter sp. TaxID=298659 RepID=UPI00262A5527|nr:DUF1801 domain-containing protein [uncultured Algibacter sp.]